MLPAVRVQLAPVCDLAKIDHLTAQSLLAQCHTRPKEVIAQLASYRLRNHNPNATFKYYPIVVEGIESAGDIDFLRSRWPKGEGELWVQGWSVRVTRPWRR